MTLRRLAAMAWFAAGACAAQSPPVRPVAPGVFYREAGPAKRIIANTGWVVFSDWVLAIDANFPWGAEAALEDLRRTTDRPVRFVFNTHHHADHSFGNAIFIQAGASVVCARECLEESLRGNAADWDVKVRTWPGEMLRRYTLAQPHAGFEEKLVFADGARRVELLRMGPAHSAGDAVAWLPAERVLFTGDLCVNAPWAGNNVADPRGGPEEWLRALDRLIALDPVHVVPGHGLAGGIGALRGQRAYLAQLISAVREGIARGLTPAEIEKRIDFSSTMPWSGSARWNTDSIRALHQRFSGKGR